ncbi:MAG TPA: hypothetical protein VIF15_06230 [Polyangiaceae bacterium]
MTRKLARYVVTLAALGVVAVTACNDYGGVGFTDGGPGAGLGGAGVGQSCDDQNVCRPGLSCNAGTCAPCQCSGNGTACVINDECAKGSYCGPSRTCTAGGSGTDGTPCKSDADCASGLRCDLVGFGGECRPEGTTDVGGACNTSADCYGGLGCSGGVCEPYPSQDGGLSPVGIPTWVGEACADPTGPTQAYFRIPRGSGDGDFYRLPFPNDVRNDAGKISLAGHPTPGPALLGYDVVDRWLRDLEATVDGFSTYPTVYFRFSAGVDLNGTLKAPGALRFVDVTVPATPVALPFGWVATTDRNSYICNNWMGIRPPRGFTLTPGHVYAIVIMNSVLDGTNQPIQPSPDLSAMLAVEAPSDPVLAKQWPKYAPLRAWAQAAGVAGTSILNATVFTVGHPAAIGPKLAAAVATAPAPTAKSWVSCATAPSPCPQATGARACGAADPGFDELHALVTLPIFQRGTEPYETPTAGGDLVLAADGTPTVQGSEAVCMALTVPKGPMPAAGWPTLVYAHGTGGSFRSHVPEGVAKRMAAVGVAVLGIDQVEHGTRRGSSQSSPDNLVYNFANPLAARGNFLQGAADQVALVRFASTLDLAAAQSPTAAEIKVGPIAFWGHSQGATEGGIAMPYTTGVRAAVLSGEGASLIDGLVGKKNPVDIADVLPVVLEDPKVDINHPVLSLLQGDLGLVDPLNHAVFLVTNPIAAANQKHVFQPYGQGDTYAPPATEQTFAIAAQLAEATAPAGVTPDDLGLPPPLPAPVSGNVTIGSLTITAVVRQYAPSGSYDGHFVAYQNPTAEADVDRFLSAALAGKVPPVGP